MRSSRPIPGTIEDRNRPTTGDIEQRTAPATPTIDGRRLRGRIPYSTESRDLGGWREIMQPGSLAGARTEDLVATVDHAGVPLARFPTTLTIEDRDDGLHWSLELPENRADVREAVERGDLRSTSWRMVVGRDRWQGNVRHVEEVRELLDVSICTRPAYEEARAELRTGEARRPQPPEDGDLGATSALTIGGLAIEDRTVRGEESASLAERFRARGFPGETATIEWGEFRTATWSGSVNDLSPVRQDGVGLGFDVRYAWPAFPQVPVDPGDTAVQVPRQSDRTLPTAANVVRAIDAVTAKPEVGSELELVATALKQVAAIETNVPNIYLEQPGFNSVIENDLRLAINEGLDKLVLDAIAASGFQAPGTDPLLVSIRKAITVIQDAGYAPDTLILTPANAETLDTLRATATAGEQFYVFPPAQAAPRTIFGLRPRVSKSAAAPVVADSRALGKLYASAITLARFEADSGTTNRSNVRLEGHAAFGTERLDACVRIAAS